jgi:hypothetical protein
MDKAELLSEFNTQLSLAEKYQSYVEKARTYADRFSSAVVEKVVTDNSAKVREIVELVGPMVEEMGTLIDGLSADRDSVLAGGVEWRMALEELELRQAIGEIADDEYEAAAGQLKEDLGSIDERVEAIDADLSELRAAVESWQSFVLEHGFTAEQAMDSSEIDLDDEDEPLFGDDDDVEMGGFEDNQPEGVHTNASDISDDVSAVFDDDSEEPVLAVDDGLSFEMGDLDLGGDSLDLSADEKASDESQAKLIQNESSDEERVFVVADSIITIGRGRTNVVQVKNDSKVSRFHCKVLCRDGSYYIEDNGSANGTLVNGERLVRRSDAEDDVSELRLFGGEEIIIGETFFRFRLGS